MTYSEMKGNITIRLSERRYCNKFPDVLKISTWALNMARNERPVTYSVGVLLES